MRSPLAAILLTIALSSCAISRPPAVVGMPKDDPDARLSAVWIGHATVLLRLGDQRVLTDPNLSGLLYIVPRDTPASVRANEIPFVHAVLISHMHFDHFDRPTLRSLSPNTAIFYPDGGQPYAGSLTQYRREALAPWQSTRVGKLTITAVPVQHFGGRYGFDAFWNHAYTGYVIEADGVKVFFGGDTGNAPELFREVGERFPGIDLALIPIAPYRGEKGNRVHANPAEALEIFRAVGARHMIPIHYEGYYGHWGGYDKPRRHLEEALAREGLEDRVFALRPGERWLLRGERPVVTRELRRKPKETGVAGR